MKIITKYECEICKTQYEKEEDAFNCETRGHDKEYKIGTLIAQDFYKNIIFVLMRNRSENHLNWKYYWAFRDTKVGDTIGKEFCTGDINPFTKYHKIEEKDKEIPAFKRAIEYLKEQNITPYIWDGEKEVKYDDK